MSAFERLKPYFKPRPRGGAPAQAPPPQGQPPSTQVQTPAAAPGAAVQSAPPPAPADGLAARREQLARRFQDLQSDLGGLVYEMAIRDAFRLDVVVRRAAELQAVDAELTGVERALGIAPPAPTPAAAASCPSCGAPAAAGSAFCGRCGAVLASPPPAQGAR